eukprot:CAMPEP_0174693764 /NCGR_PEP_ID=MMETSP1094-20130205/413_1 /TAXON_ID=156173 /ORGANISM="Chrysochromulina brevifilum, Strain UTEX LB 985" /LENGTH=56 /DNA_ID=CAMNT_0015889769 /DNA_START=139 /DNA_END=306 /DNA_ORIENTATION=-
MVVGHTGRKKTNGARMTQWRSAARRASGATARRERREVRAAHLVLLAALLLELALL